jgi:heptosyltransferase-1
VRIAVVKLSSLGDVVHALPVAATLRAARPDARLTWIVERREAALLRDHPALDEVVAIDTRAWRRARSLRRLGEVAGAVGVVRARLRAARFDVAVDLQGLLKSGLLTLATGAPLRIGFAWPRSREGNAFFTNRRVLPPPEARHVVDQYLALLAPLGVTRPVHEFRLPADAAAEAQVGDFFAASGLKPRDRVVVLNPGAGRADKRWLPERFAALARGVVAAGARVLVVWGPGEVAAARAIAAAVPDGRAVLAPPTDLFQLIAVLRRASVMGAGDTGPLHVAAALGTPCVALFGPTSAERNGPYGAGHRALQAPDGRLASLAAEDALAAVRGLLA